MVPKQVGSSRAYVGLQTGKPRVSGPVQVWIKGWEQQPEIHFQAGDSHYQVAAAMLKEHRAKFELSSADQRDLIIWFWQCEYPRRVSLGHGPFTPIPTILFDARLVSGWRKWMTRHREQVTQKGIAAVASVSGEGYRDQGWQMPAHWETFAPQQP